MKNKTKVHTKKLPKRSMQVMLFLVAVLLLVTSTFAISTPTGIGGHIYELDGITEVAAGTRFSINDTTNGFFIQGKTGRGESSGKYFVAFEANEGDSVIVKAWNPDHVSQRTVVLEGVLQDVDLLLNTSAMSGLSLPTSEVFSSSNRVQKLDKRVYQYVALSNVFSESLDFKVAKSWLLDNHIAEENIALHGFKEGVWFAMPTLKVKEEEEFVEYRSAPGTVDFFAIAVDKESSLETINQELSFASAKIPKPYPLSGIFKNTLGVPKDTKYTLLNKETGEEIKGVIRGEGFFFESVYGRIGDDLELSVPIFNAKFEFKLRQDMTNGEFVIKKLHKGFVPLTIILGMLSVLFIAVFLKNRKHRVKKK